MYPVRGIFEPSTHLHLVLWNRLNADDHQAAMEALNSLMKSALVGGIMPLIRPLGRPHDTYRRYAYDTAFQDADFSNLELTPLLDGHRTAHCEVWVQASNSANGAARAELIQLFTPIGSSCFFWENRNPIWQPLGDDKDTCQYTRSRANSQDALFGMFCDDRIAWTLKLIWFRATEVICEWLNSVGSFQPLVPDNGLHPLATLMKETFGDLDLKQYGILDKSLVIDPSAFGASHLAAFAFNAITAVQPNSMHQVTQYLKDQQATHPSSFPDRDSFLGIFPA